MRLNFTIPRYNPSNNFETPLDSVERCASSLLVYTHISTREKAPMIITQGTRAHIRDDRDSPGRRRRCAVPFSARETHDSFTSSLSLSRALNFYLPTARVRSFYFAP